MDFPSCETDLRLSNKSYRRAQSDSVICRRPIGLLQVENSACKASFISHFGKLFDFAKTERRFRDDEAHSAPRAVQLHLAGNERKSTFGCPTSVDN